MKTKYMERPEFPYLLDQKIDPVKRGNILFDQDGNQVVVLAVLDDGWRFWVGIMPDESEAS